MGPEKQGSKEIFKSFIMLNGDFFFPSESALHCLNKRKPWFVKIVRCGCLILEISSLLI